MNNKNRKLIIFTDGQLDMIEELKDKTKFKSTAEIIRNGLALYHKSYFPAYKMGNTGDQGLSEETIIRQAKMKARSKKAIADEEEFLKLKPKMDMCENLLKGEVTTNEKGDKFCSFKQYTLNGENDLLLPLRQVDPVIAETSLFMPSRQAVFKHREDVKKLFSK